MNAHPLNARKGVYKGRTPFIRYIVPCLLCLAIYAHIVGSERNRLISEADYYKGLSVQYKSSIRQYHARWFVTQIQRDCLLHALQSTINDDESMGE